MSRLEGLRQIAVRTMSEGEDITIPYFTETFPRIETEEIVIAVIVTVVVVGIISVVALKLKEEKWLKEQMEKDNKKED